MAPLICAKCSCPLFEPSATGVCVRCASGPGSTGLIVRSAPNTPQGFRDGTAPGAVPNPFAPTATGPFEVLTADPPGAPGAPPRPLPLSPAGYQIIGWLGDGGMGYVFSAMELASSRLVALKFMRHPNDPGLFERFVQEFRALRQLEHPHVVRVFAHDFHRADPYFTMELVDGGSLAARLWENGPLAAADAVALVLKVARAVRALHELRCYGNPNGPVIHRDIKPGNILLTAAGEPKLADFGLVKYLDASAALTMTDDIVGTAQYMPPEQINRANGALDVRADVYGLGATLYHLLTGSSPFRGECVPDILNAVLWDAPVRPRALRPELPLALEAVVLKCLAKDPDHRYQSVADLIRALECPDRDDAPRYTRRRRFGQWVAGHRKALALGAGVASVGASALCVGLALAHPVPPKAAPLPPPVSPPERPWALAPAVPVPNFTPELTAKQVGEEFGRGNRVTLVSERAPRVPLGRAVGPCVFEAGNGPGEGFLLKSRGATVAELLGAPGGPRYTVRAQFRQDLKGRPPGGVKDLRSAEVGLVLGHVGLIHENTAVHFLVALSYGETAPDGPARDLELSVRAIHDRPLQPLDIIQRRVAHLPIGPCPESGWRALEADVGPGGIIVRWNGQTMTGSVADLTRLFAECAADLRRTVKQNGDGIVAPEWEPRLPLGLWVSDSWASVRNVTIEP